MDIFDHSWVYNYTHSSVFLQLVCLRDRFSVDYSGVLCWMKMVSFSAENKKSTDPFRGHQVCEIVTLYASLLDCNFVCLTVGSPLLDMERLGESEGVSREGFPLHFFRGGGPPGSLHTPSSNHLEASWSILEPSGCCFAAFRIPPASLLDQRPSPGAILTLP